MYDRIFESEDEHGKPDIYHVFYRRLSLAEYIEHVLPIKDGRGESDVLVLLQSALREMVRDITGAVTKTDDLPLDLALEVYAGHPALSKRG